MPVIIAITVLLLFYFLGYRGYSRRISEKVFGLSERELTPAHNPKLRDDYDYIPTDRHILWGHHYTSVAGAAPIIGPTVAVIWGWGPALFWIVFGTIFIGAVHDFGALVLSARKDGQTIGGLTSTIINPRVHILFQIVVYFLVWVVLAVFAFAIGILFDRYPASVIPVNFEIIVAILIGFIFRKKKGGIFIPSVLALLSLYAMVAVGVMFPISLTPLIGEGGNPVIVWAVFLLIYAAIASLMPVWLLLQPRDYINSHQLIVGLIALFLGLFILNPEMNAPVLNLHPEGAPPLFPIIFVTIACGAISGFHGLVASATTSKQLNKMGDARFIGYGGMLGEGVLALIATLAVAAGLPNWGSEYEVWNASGINAISNFVAGAGHFLEALLLPRPWAQALVAILAISFAATSMDTGARIQRLVVSELGSALKIPILKNRYIATLIAVGPAIPLVMAGPKVWLPLWLLFGTTNQLIGGMTLLVLFVYLYRNKKPLLHIAIPMVFLVTITTGAMIYNILTWISEVNTANASANWMTILIGTAILILEIWMIVEALLILKKLRRERLAQG
ncbi:Carbon starvation protein A [hydrothermal vent metagenome]|uniref:Carbon starvation protein A n=1 Tax=hydrothermal vent metagenome TaxID=652676 RepID=A0A3B1CSA1_9ZZZZ